MTESTFNTLIKGCRNYERKAQRRMVDRLVPFLLAVCKRYEHSHSAAQDLVQDALILIFNHIEDCKPEEKTFMAWCKRIAINVSLERIRRKKIPFENIDASESSHSLQPEVLDRLGAEEIIQTLNLLPDNQKLVFNLYVIDGYTHAEISELLCIKESSSRTLLVRARNTLQDLISKKELLNNEY